jgi:hypothetical protein
MSKPISRTKKVITLFTILIFAFLGVAVVLSLAKTAQARAASEAPSPGELLPEFIISVSNTGTLNIIDTRTDTLYGPFLKGELGTEGGGLFDVAVTPDGKMALVSNFGDMIINFVDVSNPLSPTFVSTVSLPMFAEDIEISKDGRFALVTDGGFAYYISTIDIQKREVITTGNFITDDVASQAVAIGAYNTVVTVNYFDGKVNALLLEANGELTHTHSYTYLQRFDGSILSQTLVAAAQQTSAIRPPGLAPGGLYPDNAEVAGSVGAALQDYHKPRPINVAIAPDGKTVFVMDVSYYNSNDSYPDISEYLYSVVVYEITAPGELTLTDVITGLTRATQSIAFSLAGDKAYLSGNGGIYTLYPPAHLSVVNILGPGQAELEVDGIIEFARFQGSQLFGVDTIAVTKHKVYLGHPTMSGVTPYLRIVNLWEFSEKRMAIPKTIGVARLIKQVYIPLLYR